MNTPVAPNGDKRDCTAPKAAHYSFPLWAAFFLLCLLFVLSVWIFHYAVSPGPLKTKGGVAALIPSKSGFSGIEKILIQNSVIDDDVRFRLLARITGKGQKLKAGEYFFQPQISPYEVLVLIESGKVISHPITIPEGSSLGKIADIFASNNWIEKELFYSLARQKDILEEFGINGDSLEGYLFPDTYYLSIGEQDETDIIDMMIGRFLEIYEEISTSAKSSFSQHELVTLASIVEKETARAEERPIIAQVFINRLQKGMRLQADPTVLYGRGKNTNKITKADLTTPTPYNTYVITGLPPGPICSPGRESLMSVMNPAVGEYLYFVSKNDGSHHFSRTLTEHNEAVQKFQR